MAKNASPRTSDRGTDRLEQGKTCSLPVDGCKAASLHCGHSMQQELVFPQIMDTFSDGGPRIASTA